MALNALKCKHGLEMVKIFLVILYSGATRCPGSTHTWLSISPAIFAHWTQSQLSDGAIIFQMWTFEKKCDFILKLVLKIQILARFVKRTVAAISLSVCPSVRSSVTLAIYA